MSQAEVYQWVKDLSNAQAEVLNPPSGDAIRDATSARVEQFYQEALRDFYLQDYLVSLESIAYDSTTDEYTIPTGAVRVLAVFCDGLELSLATLKELQGAYGADFRTVSGRPRAFYREESSIHKLKLFPRPEAIPHTIQILATGLAPAIPSWLNLLFALEILSREFAVDSPHTDKNFSQSCSQLRKLLADLFL